MDLFNLVPATIAVVAIVVRLLPATDLGMGAGPARRAARGVKPAHRRLRLAFSK